jgi:hypothetical protein
VPSVSVQENDLRWEASGPAFVNSLNAAGRMYITSTMFDIERNRFMPGGISVSSLVPTPMVPDYGPHATHQAHRVNGAQQWRPRR